MTKSENISENSLTQYYHILYEKSMIISHVALSAYSVATRDFATTSDAASSRPITQLFQFVFMVFSFRFVRNFDGQAIRVANGAANDLVKEVQFFL